MQQSKTNKLYIYHAPTMNENSATGSCIVTFLILKGKHYYVFKMIQYFFAIIKINKYHSVFCTEANIATTK